MKSFKIKIMSKDHFDIVKGGLRIAGYDTGFMAYKIPGESHVQWVLAGSGGRCIACTDYAFGNYHKYPEKSLDYILKLSKDGRAATQTKPPIGLKPRKIAEHERVSEILQAIGRYHEASKHIPLEWIRELEHLCGFKP